MSIEHIEPQSSILMTDAELASIGNLWFLKTAFNNQLGNSPAIVKLRQYKDSQLPCDKVLLTATNWSAAEIQLRTEELAEKFWAVVDMRFGLSTPKPKVKKSKAIKIPKS